MILRKQIKFNSLSREKERNMFASRWFKARLAISIEADAMISSNALDRSCYIVMPI